MILLPIEAVSPYINSYYLTFIPEAELLGFMPCSKVSGSGHTAYYSVETTRGSRVVPVFYIHDFLFGSQPLKDQAGPALFFKGSDDGHMGIKFNSREQALQWIDEQPINDFELLISIDTENYKRGRAVIPFHYHN